MKLNAKILNGWEALQTLKNAKIIPSGEIGALLETLRGEEAEAIAERLTETARIFATMPKTYETGDDPATAYLHYFMGSWDWYITEKDAEAEQVQAFGWVKSELCPQGEFGYISLEEITENGAELDLYFTPQTLAPIIFHARNPNKTA